MKKFCKILLLTASIWAFSSCFPMGLPEYFCPGEQLADQQRVLSKDSKLSAVLEKMSSRQKWALVVVSDSMRLWSGISAEPEYRTLGHQYLFGIFPITRVFYQHSTDSLLLELVIDALEREGFAVAVVRKSKLKHAVGLLRTEMIIEPEFRDVSINAYDAFFFRILRVSGELEIDFLAKDVEGQVSLVKRVTEDVSDQEYRRYGHAYSLSRLTEKALGGVIQEILGSNQERLARRRRAQKLGVVPGALDRGKLVVVLPPVFSRPPPARLGELLRSSYGFSGLSPLRTEALLRLVQRGTEEGLEKLDLGVLSLSKEPEERVLELESFPGTAWVLRTSIEEARTEPEDQGYDAESLKLEVRYQLSEYSSERIALFIKTKCSILERRARGVDGCWIFTLERAAYQLAREFFDSRHSGVVGSEGASCGTQ